LLEGTLRAYRDQWVEVPWHQPAATRKTHRNGCYPRKRWPTALGRLENVRVPRCRDKAFTEQMLTRLDHHCGARLLVAHLRPSNIDASRHTRPILKRLVHCLR
jgi:hypothetical protein